MGGVNAAIDVGKRQLAVALGSAGEQFCEPNEPRAIKRLTRRLAEAGCERVLLEGGSYQNLLAESAARCGATGEPPSLNEQFEALRRLIAGYPEAFQFSESQWKRLRALLHGRVLR